MLKQLLSQHPKLIIVRKHFIQRWQLLLLFMPFLFLSCWDFNRKPIEPSIQEEAYVPIYGFDTALRSVKNLVPQPTVKAGKVYVFGKYLFQVEENAGIHVIDYSNKANPVKLTFIKSMGCSEVAVKNGLLITNNMNDLVSVNISNLQTVKEVSRVKNAFKNYYYDWYNISRPPERGKYYVCPEYQRGDILSWKLEKKVPNAYCFNN